MAANVPRAASQQRIGYQEPTPPLHERSRFVLVNLYENDRDDRDDEWDEWDDEEEEDEDDLDDDWEEDLE